MRILKIVPLLLLLLPVTSFAQAQARLCDITDTFDACAMKCIAGGKQSAVEAKDNAAVRNMKMTNAGTETGGDATTSSVTDLLSPVVLSALVSDSGSGSSGGRVTIDLNTLAPREFLNLGGKLQAEVDLEPDLFDPFTMKLKESLETQAFGVLEEKLKGELSNTDDVTFKLTFNLINQRAGRDFETHREEFEALLSQLQPPDGRLNERLAWGRFFRALDQVRNEGSISPDLSSEIEQRLLSARNLSNEDLLSRDDLFGTGNDGGLGIGNSPDALQAELGDQTFMALAQGDEAAAEEFRAAFESAVSEGAAFDSRLQKRMESKGLNLFSALVNNQQQFNLSVKRQMRSDLVGPDQTSVELKWERPLARSIGGFMKAFRGKQGRSCEALPAECLSAYQRYVQGNEADIKSGDRLSLSVEYADVDALTIDRPDDDVLFEQAAAKKLIAKLGYGRSLEVDASGVAQSRIDLSLAWEDVSDDPMRQDRGVARLTFTRNMGGVAVPFSLVYATKPEFLAMEGVKEELSAHVGITFSIDDLLAKKK
jgi:hypothetical protein